MEKRKGSILNIIIKEHIKTGVPVGSGILVEKYKLGISPATVRNEMAELEEEGYIVQPHTSAGRIPTEKAYSFYLNSLKGKKLSSSDLKLFEKLLTDRDEKHMKQTAKEMARISGNTIFWATDKDHFFYTGISNLLSQPEFAQSDVMRHLSLMIDRVDEIIDDMFDDMEYDTKVLLGSENPFGDFCGTILVKYKAGNKEGIFGILGPMRMDYEKNLGLADFINKRKKIMREEKIEKTENRKQKTDDNKNDDCLRKCEEIEHKYKRALADYQNLIKQTARDKEEFIKFANERLIEEILPVYDNLKVSLSHIGDEEKKNGWAEGIKHIVSQFKNILENIGVEEIKTTGEKFDPNTMEAVSQEETENEKQDGMVERELSAGYKLKGKVIRAARVAVFKMKHE